MSSVDASSDSKTFGIWRVRAEEENAAFPGQGESPRMPRTLKPGTTYVQIKSGCVFAVTDTGIRSYLEAIPPEAEESRPGNDHRGRTPQPILASIALVYEIQQRLVNL